MLNALCALSRQKHSLRLRNSIESGQARSLPCPLLIVPFSQCSDSYLEIDNLIVSFLINTSVRLYFD